MHILINAVSSARHPSGICRHAANLTRSLAIRAEVSRITLLVGKWQEYYFRTVFALRDPKLEISPVNIANGSLDRNWWYLRGLPKIVAACSPDIVHLSFPIPVARRRFSCPVIVSLHDLYPYDAPSNFGSHRAVFNRLFLHQCLRSSDAIVCASDFTLDRLRLLMPRIAGTKAVRVYQCVEVDKTNMRQSLLAEVSGRPFFLAVAQHRKNKNLKLLVDAFAKLQERDEAHRNTCLLVVGGEGPETVHLKNLVRQHSLEEHVYFKTSVTDPELWWLYANCGLFLAPSTIEGFGMPLIEALRCGCRVVCSDIPVFREIAGAACQYFDLHSESPTSALVNAACAALRDQPGKPEMLSRFSAQEIGAQYVSLYSNLLSAGSNYPDMATAISLNRTFRYDRFVG
jgi:glycosyltransferase involved in cell wall biosynthesis